MSVPALRATCSLLTMVSAVPLLLLLSSSANAQAKKADPKPAAASSQSEEDYKKHYDASVRLSKKAQEALDAGDTKNAVRLAKAWLATHTNKADWNYGNVYYEANQIIGLAALQDGDIAKAKTYLLIAGSTPGSPQLNSFGPDMPLAKALVKKGERATVSEFLTRVAKFWATAKPGTSKQFAGLYEMHARMIARWKKELKEGKTPSLDTIDVEAAETNLEAKAPERPELLAAGTTAPDFSAIDKDEKTVKLSDYRGKIVVVDFWASWCPPCVASMPHNQEVIKKLQAEGLPVVLLAVDNSEERPPFLKWVGDHKEMDALTFVHADPRTTDIAGKPYHVSGIPTQYVIDGQGVIRKSFVGYGEPNDDLEKAVRAALTAAPEGK